MVMDAKALYDSLLSEQQNQDDERAALECSIIKKTWSSWVVGRAGCPTIKTQRTP